MLPSPQPEPAQHAPRLRLLEGRDAVPELHGAGLGAWILLFGALSASGGHGIFLLCALTRLARMPSAAELGGPLQRLVIEWFVLAAPLALVAVCARRAFQRLDRRWAWGLASLASLCSAAAFASYLRAIALA